jgi:uncharacterized membrane protein
VVDVARGVAIVLMFAFHFCFDLNYFGFVQFDIYHDPFWRYARAAIVTLFLLVVGVSLLLAHAEGIRWPAVRRRTLQLVAAAALVTAGSYLLFPRSYIFFGVLHFIALASLLALPFVRVPKLALVAGLLLLWLGLGYSSPVFDQPLLNWFGLMTNKPVTEDYVPLLPWLGVVLTGLFIGDRLRSSRGGLAQWQGTEGLWRELGWAGRHSLLLYLLHQPLFFALFYLVRRII